MVIKLERAVNMRGVSVKKFYLTDWPNYSKSRSAAGLLVLAHKPAEPDHFGREDRHQSCLDALLGHRPHPPRRACETKFYAIAGGESMRVELWLQIVAWSSHPGFASSAVVGKR